MSKPPWCRLYSEVLSDRKIEYICRKTQQPKVVILGAWSIFLALANDSPQRGALLLTEDISYTMVDLVGEMGLDLETGSDIIGAFFELGLLTDDGNTFHVTNFNKRNFTSDNSAERVRKWREKQGAQGDEGESSNDYGKGNGDEALQGGYGNADVTLPETETKAQPEAKTEGEDPPTAAKPPPPPPRGKRKSAKPKTPVPPAVKVFRANAHRYPAKSWYGEVAGLVGEDERELERWGKVVKAWVGCGWNPTNVKGMLEMFRRGEIPSTSGKGKGKAEPAGYPGIRDWLEEQSVEAAQ